MTEIDAELRAILDAEYRELVRSLHREAVDIVIDIESWWTPDTARVIVSAAGGFKLSESDAKVAASADSSWRQIHRRLSVLIYGHPDPDVREAADILSKRTFASVLIMSHPNFKEEEGVSEENGLAIKLIQQGMTDLRRAVYHAPFRINRPDPEWDGVPTGNREGLPGTILRRMKERGEQL